VNIDQLVEAVIKHALDQDENSPLAIAVDGMTRDEIAHVLRTDGCKRLKQAIRALRYHAELVQQGLVQTELVPA
jgi:hypothetical protein